LGDGAMVSCAMAETVIIMAESASAKTNSFFIFGSP
jgi:hypothetical protein